MGAFTGFGIGEATFPDGDLTLDLDGAWIGGVNAGVDFVLTNGIVVGIAADATYLGLKGTLLAPPPNTGYADISLDWAGSVRGKLGFDGGAFLPYLTAGLAVASGQVESTGTVTGSDSNIHIGWTVGAGVEFAVSDNVSLDLLYKYADYGAQGYTLINTGTPVTSDVGFTAHTVTAGVNFRF